MQLLGQAQASSNATVDILRYHYLLRRDSSSFVFRPGHELFTLPYGVCLVLQLQRASLGRFSLVFIQHSMTA